LIDRALGRLDGRFRGGLLCVANGDGGTQGAAQGESKMAFYRFHCNAPGEDGREWCAALTCCQVRRYFAGKVVVGWLLIGDGALIHSKGSLDWVREPASSLQRSEQKTSAILRPPSSAAADYGCSGRTCLLGVVVSRSFRKVREMGHRSFFAQGEDSG